MHIYSVIVSAILSVATISISISFLYRLLYSKRYKSIQCLFSVTSVICVIGCTGNSIADFIHLLFVYINSELAGANNYLLLRVISDMFVYLSWIALYIFLVSKLYYTFRESMFRISTTTLIILSFLISLQALCMIGYLLIGILFELLNSTSFYIIFKYEEPVVLTMMINDLILNIFCISLFVFKLRSLIVTSVSLRHNEEVSMELLKHAQDHNESSLSVSATTRSATIERLNVNFEPKQRKLLSVMTKQLLLAVIVIIVIQIFYIEYAVMCFIIQTEELIITLYCLREFVSMVVAMTIFLNLSFNDGIYYKLCVCCHLICYKICSNKTKEIVKKQAITMTHPVQM